MVIVSRGENRDAAMKKHFSASLWREGDWFVAQCLDVDVASQGRSEDEALANLKEALELHFEAPRASKASTSPIGGLVAGRTSQPRLARKQFRALLASILADTGEE